LKEAQVSRVFLARSRRSEKSRGEAIGKSNELGDAVSADIFAEISRGAEKWLWMVQAHLGGCIVRLSFISLLTNDEGNESCASNDDLERCLVTSALWARRPGIQKAILNA